MSGSKIVEALHSLSEACAECNSSGYIMVTLPTYAFEELGRFVDSLVAHKSDVPLPAGPPSYDFEMARHIRVIVMPHTAFHPGGSHG